MKETQQSISQWAESVFGPIGSNASVAARANKEMAELLMELANNDTDPKAIEECADIVIVLLRLVDRMGGNLEETIDRKMAVNRARQWRLDGAGHGYHLDGNETLKESMP